MGELLTGTTFLLVTNILLYFVILIISNDGEKAAANETIRSYLKTDEYKLAFKILGFVNVVCTGIFGYYYRTSLTSGIRWLRLAVIMIPTLVFWASDFTKLNDYDNPMRGVSPPVRLTWNIARIVFSFGILFYFGKITRQDRGKRFLTWFMGLFILHMFLNIWSVTDIEGQAGRKNISDLRYYIYGFLLMAAWFVKMATDIRIYRVGEYISLSMLLIYSVWIIGIGESVFTRFVGLIFPALLFIVFMILNYKEFNEATLNTKFVYILSFLITIFLLYIILNTGDTKIKTFITIFLVITFNILAIVYGNKDCVSVSGSTLVKRSLKWSIILVIISLILWQDFFSSSIGGNILTIKDDIVKDTYMTDTQALEDSIRESKDGVGKTDKDKDKEKNIRSEISRIYETRARKAL